MKIVHSFSKTRVMKHVSMLPSFLMTNRIGSYLLFSDYPLSRYHGFIISQAKDFFKTLDDIKIVGDYHLNTVRNDIENVETNRRDVQERFFFPHGFNTFVYEASRPVDVELTFDCKKIFDNREFGRFYSTSVKGTKLILRYDKKNQDDADDNGEYSVFVVIDFIKPVGDFETEWQQWFYNMDFNRRSPPYERYVFSVKGLKARRLIITSALDEESAVKENEKVKKDLELLKIKSRGHYQRLERQCTGIKDSLIRLAYCNAINSIDSLTNTVAKKKNILAGLPWFTQFWTRDVLISLPGLTDNKLKKDLLLNYLDLIGEDGRLPNRFPGTVTGCADGIGWLFLRIRQDLDLFNDKEKIRIADQLKRSIKLIYENYYTNSMIRNNPQETWMDTIYNDDGRPGHRIEIQCLTLSMLDLCFQLTKQKKYRQMEDSLKKAVQKKFWNKKYLQDSPEDASIRPNIFIAYYAYPSLLEKKEWERCFNNALKSLWSYWGGLSSIDKEHHLFKPLHTGEGNESYHRGDSWFWINNLAAICMYRLNPKKFSEHITEILSASVSDIMWHGIIGHSSEISSAIEQKAEGCLAQAWSAATLKELIETLFTD